MARAELACRHDPERWFDRAHRSYALERCLGCHARSWCAGEALQCRATFGMWAGIWIDENLDEVAHYLQAITDTTNNAELQVNTIAANPAAPVRPIPDDGGGDHVGPDPLRTYRLSPAAAVEVRSSLHCEVMAPGCHYTFDAIRCRVPALAWHVADASALYGICRACDAAVDGLNPHLARRLGYVVKTARYAGSAAFYWRQARWMLLSPAGGLRDIGAAA